METQEKMEKGIGTIEPKTLKAKDVEIKHVGIIEVGEGSNKNEKVVCSVKHPDKEETINISAVEIRKGKNLKQVGLWYTEDEENFIQKGTSLAIFMEFVEAKNINELIGKKVSTILDDKGYLCFKAY